MKSKKPRPTKEEYQKISQEVCALAEQTEDKVLVEAQSLMVRDSMLMAQAVHEALKSTFMFPKITGRDDDGRPLYEYIERPDHKLRSSVALKSLEMLGIGHKSNSPLVVINITNAQFNKIQSAATDMGVQ